MFIIIIIFCILYVIFIMTLDNYLVQIFKNQQRLALDAVVADRFQCKILVLYLNG